jgi:hypothetical protein
MRRRGIARLPAVVAAGRVHTGLAAIIELYRGKGARPAAPRAAAITSVEDYFRSEMTMANAEADSKGEDGIGEGEDMTKAYRRAMERRAAPAKPPHGGRPPVAPIEDRSIKSAASTRPNNVAPLSADDAEIQETISRLSKDLGAREGGDDEDGYDEKDDIMARAYYANNFDGVDIDVDDEEMRRRMDD